MATYYVRADGTAANKAAATGPATSVSACMNLDTFQADTFSSGDIIKVSDAGGDYNITTMITIPSSGITLSGDGSPVISNGIDVVGMAVNWAWISASSFWRRTDIAAFPTALWFDGYKIGLKDGTPTLLGEFSAWENVFNIGTSGDSVNTPADLYSSIIASNLYIGVNIGTNSDVTIENILFKYFGSNYNSGAWRVGQGIIIGTGDRNIIHDCAFRYYGQAVSGGDGADDWQIYNNDFGPANSQFTQSTIYGAGVHFVGSGWKIYGNTYDGALESEKLGEMNSGIGIFSLSSDAETSIPSGAEIYNNSISNYSSFGIFLSNTKTSGEGALDLGVNIYGNVISGSRVTAASGVDADAIGFWSESDQSYYTNITVKNNILFDFYNAGIHFAGYSGIGASVHNNVLFDCCLDTTEAQAAIRMNNGGSILNNTIFNVVGSDAIRVSGKSGFAAKVNTTVKNNIVYRVSNGHYSIAKLTDGLIVSAKNTCYDDGGNSLYGFTDATTIALDPLFTDPANDDFTLQASSPCIRAGADVGLTEDILGTSIPQRGIPDIGAYEYVRAVPPATTARWQTMLRALKYKNTTAEPTAGDRTLAIHATTLTGKTSNKITGTVTVTE